MGQHVVQSQCVTIVLLSYVVTSANVVKTKIYMTIQFYSYNYYAIFSTAFYAVCGRHPLI